MNVSDFVNSATEKGLRLVLSVPSAGGDTLRRVGTWSDLKDSTYTDDYYRRYITEPLTQQDVQRVEVLTGYSCDATHAGECLSVIDIDSKHAAGVSSQEDNRAYTDNLLKRAAAYLAANGYPDLLQSLPIDYSRHNGAHIYFFSVAGVTLDGRKAVYWEQQDGRDVAIAELIAGNHLMSVYPSAGYAPAVAGRTILDAPTLSQGEYNALISAFESAYQPTKKAHSPRTYAPATEAIEPRSGASVFDAYNHTPRHIKDELTRHGYTLTEDEKSRAVQRDGATYYGYCRPGSTHLDELNISLVEKSDGWVILICRTPKDTIFSEGEEVAGAANIYARLNGIPTTDRSTLFEALAKEMGMWQDSEEYRLDKFRAALEDDTDTQTGTTTAPLTSPVAEKEDDPAAVAKRKADKRKRSTAEELKQHVWQVLSNGLTGNEERDSKYIQSLKHYAADLVAPQSYNDFLYSRMSRGGGVSTGIYLQGYEWRLRGGTINFYTAPTGHGKTTLLLNVALNVLRNTERGRVMYITLEEEQANITDYALNIYLGQSRPKVFRGKSLGSTLQTAGRSNRPVIESYYPNADHPEINRKAIDPELLKDFEECQREFAERYLATGRLLIRYLPSVEVHKLVYGLTKATEEIEDSPDKISLVVLDYMQLLSVDDDSANTRQERVKVACQRFMEFAAGVGIPVLSGAQFNREVKDWRQLETYFTSEAGDIERLSATMVGGFSFHGRGYSEIRKAMRADDRKQYSEKNKETPQGLPNLPNGNSVMVRMMKNRSGDVGMTEYIQIDTATQCIYYDGLTASEKTKTELGEDKIQALEDAQLNGERAAKESATEEDNGQGTPQKLGGVWDGMTPKRKGNNIPQMNGH